MIETERLALVPRRAGAGGPRAWTVTLRETGEAIGTCTWNGTDIGYVLAPRYRGRGYGTEMVGAVVARLAGRGAVRAETEVTNVASRRLLERLGFAVEDSEQATVTYRLDASLRHSSLRLP